MQLLRPRLIQLGRTESWATIRWRLASWVRLTTALEARTGELISSRQDVRSDAGPVALARAAEVGPGLHRVLTRLVAPTVLGGANLQVG